jgi:hypothetical protein
MTYSDLRQHNNALEQFSVILNDANHLLAYAAEAGIEIDPAVARKILEAEEKGPSNWNAEQKSDILSAIAKLAVKLHPVTPETLKACREEARGAIKLYTRIVYLLAIILVPISILSAISTGIVANIRSSVNSGNEIALSLHTTLATAPLAQIGALQQLANYAREIRGHARQLNVWNIAQQKEPETIELPKDLDYKNTDLMQNTVADITQKYQNARQYALDVVDTISIVFGAVTASILPVLYAILGACAAVLHVFSQQLEKKTFSWSYASPARFIIAGIGGGVIGLFNITAGDGLTASPLALAFLVGYAADVFFSSLESSLPHLGRGVSAVPARPATATGG